MMDSEAKNEHKTCYKKTNQSKKKKNKFLSVWNSVS